MLRVVLILQSCILKYIHHTIRICTTAFTPNSDGRNDIFKPIMAGMQRLDMFAVYNRWGQQVFSTKVPEKGWDGRVSGVVQASGTYIWILKAVDFNGLPYSKQGNSNINPVTTLSRFWLE